MLDNTDLRYDSVQCIISNVEQC